MIVLVTFWVDIVTVRFVLTIIWIFFLWFRWLGSCRFCRSSSWRLCCCHWFSTCRWLSCWWLSCWCLCSRRFDGVIFITVNIGGPVAKQELRIEKQSIGTRCDVGLLVSTLIKLCAIWMSINSIFFIRTECCAFSWLKILVKYMSIPKAKKLTIQ